MALTLCTVIPASSPSSLASMLGTVETGCAEIRADFYRGDPLEALEIGLSYSGRGLRLLFTLRSRRDGGLWGGGLNEKARILSLAASRGAWAVDVESWEARRGLDPGGLVVVSSHPRDSGRATVEYSSLPRLRSSEVYVYKLVWPYRDLQDLALAYRITRESGGLVTAFNTGDAEASLASRLLSAVAGGRLVFGAHPEAWAELPGVPTSVEVATMLVEAGVEFERG